MQLSGFFFIFAKKRKGLPIIAVHFRATNTIEKFMLNSRSLVLVIFAAWCAICWRWYVCGIKKACNGGTSANQQIVQTSQPAPDTVMEDLTAKSETTPPKRPAFEADKIEKVQFEEVEDRMLIHFPYNSIRKEDDDAIDEYLSQLAQRLIASGETVSITGHADFVGGTKFNTSFGQRRANSIRDILVKKGVSKSKIKCRSFGDRKPVATNDTPKGRYLNRRVEIKVGK